MEWTVATDPDGDPVDYVWQLASDDAFATVLFFDDIPAAENTTTFITDVFTMAGLLDDHGMGASPARLFHRVLTTDGQTTTEGPVAQLTPVRGTLTALDDDADVPGGVRLAQNYPNPFNPATRIEYVVDRASPVRLTVYDVLGREIAELVEGAVAPGTHAAVFEAGERPGGVYVYRLEAGGWVRTRLMLQVK